MRSSCLRACAATAFVSLPTWREEPLSRLHDRNGFDCGDAADRLSVAQREKQLPVCVAIERIRLGVECIANGDAQRWYPLRVFRGVTDLPREIDEPAQVARGAD